MTTQQISFLEQFDNPQESQANPGNEQKQPRTLADLVSFSDHPVFDLGIALFRGSPEDRARRLIILERMIDMAGSSVANDGQMQETALTDIQKLVEEIRPDDVSDLVHKMSQDGLLNYEGKSYLVAPLTTALVQFIRFIARLQDETGSSAAVISSVFSYQLEIAAQGDPLKGRPGIANALKTVILDINRYSNHLEDAIRHSVLADLDTIVKDLGVVDYFCGVLDSLVHQLAGLDVPGDVFWLERARRVIHRLRTLIEGLQRAYSMRISKSLSGTGRFVTDEVMERWLVHALENEKPQLAEFGQKLDNPAYVSVYPCWLMEQVAQEGPQDGDASNQPDKPALLSRVFLGEGAIPASSEDEMGMKVIEELQALIMKRGDESLPLSDLILPNDWSASAMRVCYLGTAIEMIERETGEKWSVDAGASEKQFGPDAQVSIVKEAEVGKWTYLIQKKSERGEF